MLRRITLPIALLAVLVGCFDVQQKVELNEDLSGTARIHMTVDMEPMVHMMAAMKRGFEGLEGPPTEEELAAARAEMSGEQAEQQRAEFESQKAELEASLPEGVTLVSAEMLEGEAMGAEFTFAFDHIAQLKEIRMAGEQGSDTDSPFADLTVEEKDGTLLISTPPVNPSGDLGPMGGDDSDEDDPTAQMVQESIESMRVLFELSSPLEVLEHNATDAQGDTLIWEYGFEQLKSMAESEEEVEAVRVLYKL